MHSASGRHPIEYLVDGLQNISCYPGGLVRVPDRISGTAFFPGGYGLWREDGGPLPLMPCGEVMVLGQDVFVYRVEARKSAKWCAGLVRMCRYVQYGSRGRQTGRFEGARARG